MNNKLYLPLFCITIMVIPSACSTEVMASRATFPIPTRYRTNTNTLPSTPTTTNTWVPSSTPTVGPPPDMELRNVTIYPEFGDYNSTGQNYSILGRVKNNTGQIMVFRYQTLIFRFTFDIWEYGGGYEKKFLHQLYSEDVEEYSDIYRRMNCILYPGDEGVFMYDTKPSYADHIIHDYSLTHDGPLGIWYTYEGIYNINPGLPLDYHPPAENLIFEIKNGIITFDYDIMIPSPKNPGHIQIFSYILLVNKEGRIINILKKDIIEFGGVKLGKPFSVHGTTATSISDRQNRFIQTVKLTNEMIEKVDHIEIFNEFQPANIC